MNIEEIELLVARLKPQADEDTVNAVIREIVAYLTNPKNAGIHDLQPKKPVTAKKKKPVAHSLFGEWNPNDPRNW